MNIPMSDVHFIAFVDINAAKKVKKDYGGWLYVPEDPGHLVLWFPHSTPTAIMTNPACRGNGALI